MAENLVIVESPAKAKTIEKILGKEYLVKSSFGHVRDLTKSDLSIDVENQYKPNYVVSPDKKKVVTELKKEVKSANVVWLASDEDREGEAIAWHLSEVLKLKPENTKRIVFHEITKNAIVNAINNPRDINYDLVQAQQARRILDRLVGYELSPVLWKKVKPALSAGRVQSVAVRLLVDREREIRDFKSTSSYRVLGIFLAKDDKGKEHVLNAELNKRFETREETLAFLERCKHAEFSISEIVKKPSKKSPAPPFTTSTLQQEAARKFGFSVGQTMSLAQKLYEAGKITYMRTDSVNLSDLAVNTAKQEILEDFGEDFYKFRKYRTKAKGAQEAHEAIRPTYINQRQVSGPANEQRLYELIWKRTVASQMADARLEKTNMQIDISNTEERFVASGEIIKFEGFLKVYLESTDSEEEENHEGLLPPLKQGDILDLSKIDARQKFTHHPARYTEASLVKKLEELGIGRPSTYAPTISTIQAREYVIKEDREGIVRDVVQFVFEESEISEKNIKENTGFEKSKLYPTDIGMVVNDFLNENFKEIMDFNFTARVEKDFDEIASGKKNWVDMIDAFYKGFHKVVEHTLENSEKSQGKRLLGDDPKTGKPVFVKIGRYGPMAQIGEVSDEEKPRFARLQKGQFIETISLEEALDLFKLPRTLGSYEEVEVTVGVGRFGPYVRHKNSFYSLKKGIDDPMSVNLERAIELIEEKREADKKKLIKEFDEEPELKILNGRYGPYISYQKKNFRIPKGTEPESLDLAACKEIIEKSAKTKNGKTSKRTKKK